MFLLHISQTPSATPISRCPSDMIHLVLVRLDRDDVPSLEPSWIFVSTSLLRVKGWRQNLNDECKKSILLVKLVDRP